MFRLINLVALLCILSFGYCLVNIGKTYVYTTSLLPVTFLVLSIIFNKIYKSYSKSNVFKLFILQASIRYCLLPALISTDQIFVAKYDSYYLNISILIMLLELLLIFIVFVSFSKKQKNSYLSESYYIVPFYGRTFIWLLLVSLFLFYYTYYSGAFSKITLIWNLNDYIEQYVTGDEELTGLGFGVISFKLLKSLIALWFISLIYKSKKIANSIKKWLYLLVILLSGTFIIGTSRFSLILFVLPLLILIGYIISENDYKKLFGFTSILMGVALLVTTIAKFTRYGNSVSAESIFSASSINAYFSGPGNIVIGLEAYESMEGYESLFYFINDTFQNVPLLSKITSDEFKGTLKFNEQYYGHSLYADQIVPLSISGLFHFGVIGILFYPMFFMSIALYIERISYKSRFIAYKYLFIFLSINFSLIYMFNVGSFYSSLSSAFLFLFIPFLLIRKFQRIRFR